MYVEYCRLILRFRTHFSITKLDLWWKFYILNPFSDQNDGASFAFVTGENSDIDQTKEDHTRTVVRDNKKDQKATSYDTVITREISILRWRNIAVNLPCHRVSILPM